MTSVACYTSFNYAYLGRARVLAATLARVHPEWERWALVVDRAPADLPDDALACFDRVIGADELAIAGFRRWIFLHDAIEACTAVKGAMLARLLAPPDGEAGRDRVIYLDPDIALFDRLDGVLARLDRASVVLTPHQTAPDDTASAIHDNERAALRYGVFNLGFLAVANDTVGRAFAAWWAARLHDACYDAPAEGLFTDQKYCDLVPALFDRVAIERDPGCNVASWNLSRRRLRFGPDGRPRVNGRPLRFYHFTKIGAIGDTMTARYAGDNVAVHELVAWYKRELAQATPEAAARHPWAYGQFSDGTPIPKAARVRLRTLGARFDDPFDAGPGGYLAWLRAEADILSPAAEA